MMKTMNNLKLTPRMPLQSLKIPETTDENNQYFKKKLKQRKGFRTRRKCLFSDFGY